jgi:hypothetical protein
VLGGASVLMTLAIFVLTANFPISDVNPLDSVVFLLFIGAFSGMGYLLASRRPDNPIGWIFGLMGFGITVGIFTGNYAEHALRVDPGALPVPEMMAWVGNWYWALGLAPIAFVLLLFPDGRPLSPRWGIVGRLIALAMAVWFVAWAFMPGPMTNAGYDSIDNPLGVPVAGPILRVLGAASGIVLIGGIVASALSVIFRFRRSAGNERRQMKWLTYAGGVVLVAVVVSILLEFGLGPNPALVKYLQLALTASLAAVPVAIGVAILRYRLYDIDLIINRTLVYGALTAILAGTYVLIVTIAGTLIQGSELVTAAATLGVAGLFQPLRRRIQGFIDRRFYRSRYDAARTVEAFSNRLRDEVDLEAMRAQLVGAVQQTMQPRRVSLWLRS